MSFMISVFSLTICYCVIVLTPNPGVVPVME